MKAASNNISGSIKNLLAMLLPNSWMTVRGEKVDSIYLTFDDGPHPDITPQLLDLLETRNAKATFFLVGTNIEAYPELVNRIIANGHSVGNHSYDHKRFHELELKTQLRQVITTNELIERITGAKCKLFRAPGGRLSAKLLFQLIKLGITSVHWSKDSLDWKLSAQQAIDYLTEKPVRNGDIVLLHDDHQKVVSITEFILDKHRSSNFENMHAG